MARKDHKILSAKAHQSGHRQRIRQRILEHGTANLADYELLEALLFYAVPRRDTKPLAKNILERFGSLAALFQVPTETLQEFGLTERVISVLKIAPLTARALTTVQEVDTSLQLNDIVTLKKYVFSRLKEHLTPETYLFYLDGRNNLLKEELIPHHTKISEQHRNIATQMIENHATAFIIVHIAPEHSAVVLAQEARGIALALKPLSIVMHDVILFGEGWISSLRKEGLL